MTCSVTDSLKARIASVASSACPAAGLSWPQGLRQSEMTQAVSALIGRFRRAGRHARLEVGHRRIEAPGPQCDRPAARQQLRAEFGMASMHFLGQLRGQGFRPPGGGRGGLQVAGAAGQRQPDQGSGQPRRDLVGGGTRLEHALGGLQRGGAAGLLRRVGQPGRGQYQPRLRAGPPAIAWHAAERLASGWFRAGR